MDTSRDLGLFPLELVALPGERVPLHLFEPRYRQLYADCVLEDRPFVIVQAGPAGTADVGCSLRFTSLIRRFADGRLSVVATGVAPIAIGEETEGRLYLSARVRELADDPGVGDPAVVDDVLTRFRALADLAPDAVPRAEEGLALSYAVAAGIDIPNGIKQELLSSRDEAERLRVVARLLTVADRQARHVQRAAERASTNGRVTAP